MEKDLIKKIYYLVISLIVLSLFNLVIGLISISNLSSTKTQTTTSNTTENEYDVSKFNSVTLKEVLDLIASDKTSVVYLGRETCSACVVYLPTLTKVQEEYKFTTNYLDITTVDTKSEDYQKFLEKLTKKIEPNINGETKSGTIAEFYGYTPMTLVIKDKKVVDAAIGAYNETKLKEFLNKYDIK